MEVAGTEPQAELPSDLGEALRRTARRCPGRGVAIVDLQGRADRRTFPQLLEAVGSRARSFAGAGVGRGDRVLVALPTSWGWIGSWLGALELGALPVAAAPAGAKGLSAAHLHRLEGIRQGLDARRVVAEGSLRLAAEREGLGELAGCISTPEELAALPAGGSFQPLRRDPDEVAFLQLTSGSTGTPRAVAISHRAAIHNTLAIDAGSGAPHGRPAREWIDGWVSWLPLYHDMGLVGCLLHAIVCGWNLTLLEPRSFVASPWSWLRQMGGGGPRFATAPNFGYQLCVDRAPRYAKGELDLAPWKAAMVGAEMIRPETLGSFCEVFAECGFSPAAVRPCYGLAEATLAVTLDVRGEGLRTAAPRVAGKGEEGRVACVGAPVADTEVRVVAPDGLGLAAGAVGEVQVRGPGVCAGYWGDPEGSAALLRDGWLITGDLGFLHGGELYLSGRLKDLLIVRGQNLPPHELEWIAESVMELRTGYRGAAFSVPGDGQGEQAVLVVETELRDLEGLSQRQRALRLRIADEFYLPLADVVFVRRGTIPRTTSGKLQRRELRQRYLAGELRRIDHES